MANTKPSLLFLTTDLPYPADSGGRIKSFKLLQHLSKSFDVRLLCAFGGERLDDISALKQAVNLSSIQAFRNHLPRTRFHFIRALLTSASFNAYRVYSTEFENMVKWSSEKSDVVLVDHLEMIDQVPEKLKTKTVYHSHNAEYVLWKETGKVNGNFFTQWLYDWESHRVKMLERYAIRLCDITFAAPNDQTALSQINGVDISSFKNTYHLGNDEMLSLPTIPLAEQPYRVFYAGTLSWEPNRDGLEWFIKSCWPLVRQAIPQAEFNICGRGADDSLKSSINQAEGVNYLGFVENLEDEMNHSRCAVVPLRMGSGMKIKTFDALYRGLPLVTTSFGAEGIDLNHLKHAYITDESKSFANSVIQVLNDPEKATELRDAARELCTKQYKYKPLLEQMENDIRSIL